MGSWWFGPYGLDLVCAICEVDYVGRVFGQEVLLELC